MIDVSVIIINYNTFLLTSKCIASIIEYTKDITYEIILIDNASTECDANLFLEKYPIIKLVKSTVNTGFSGGNNLGILQAKGEYILLLNSDTELISNALKLSYDYASTEKNLGVLTCQLLYPNGIIQHNCRKFRTFSFELLELIPLKKILFSKKNIEKYLLHHYFDHQSYTEPDWVWGAYMFIPKVVINNLPNQELANDFFMYCEDVLWCFQIKSMNKKIQFYPDIKVIHIGHGSSRTAQKMIKIVRTSIENHATVIKKYYRGWKWILFAPIYYTKQYFLLLSKIIFIKLKIVYE